MTVVSQRGRNLWAPKMQSGVAPENRVLLLRKRKKTNRARREEPLARIILYTTHVYSMWYVRMRTSLNTCIRVWISATLAQKMHGLL